MTLPRFTPISPQPQSQQGPLPMFGISAAALLQLLTKPGGDQVLSAAGAAFPVIPVNGGQNLIIIARVQGAAGTVNFGPRFNGDSAVNYSFLNLFSTGAGAQDGAAATASFIEAGQASNTTSAALACFVPGYRVAGLTNNPVISICANAGIVLVRGAYWNQGVAISTVQMVADANMAAGSYCSILVV